MGIKSNNIAAAFHDFFSRSGKDAVNPVPPPPPPFAASGGAQYVPGNGYKYHIFSDSNSGNFECPGAPGSFVVDILMVGGGGSGGTFSPSRAGSGGGGGAGGVVHITNLPLVGGTYPVSIGDGGTGVSAYSTNGNPGGDTSFVHPSGTVTAYGGGGGGNNGATFADPASGSGGGAGSNRNTPPSGQTFTGDAAQKGNVPGPVTPFAQTYGNVGGNAYANPPYTSGGSANSGGGGGGAGQAGGSGSPPNTYGGGGNGQPFSTFAYPLVGLSALGPHSPSNDHYGGGGACGNNNTALGGHGGGGDASSTPGTTAGSTPGINQLGGGGGAINYPNRLVDAPGGSGVLMIRYAHSEPTPPIQGGITAEPGNGYKYHTFTAPGTFTLSETKDLEVLIVGAGGCGRDGGGAAGGGGGGGEIIHRSSLPQSAGSYPIVVGGISPAKSYNFPDHTPISFKSSSAFGLTADGGGDGGAYSPLLDGQPGGSGGGGGSYPGAGSGGGATGGGGVGGNGSTGGDPAQAGGGGGGAAEGGKPGAPGPSTRSDGGNGSQYSQFEGTLIGVPSLAPLNGYFAGGGGGGIRVATAPERSQGGLGGGGIGGTRTSALDAGDGAANSGGGGGGGSTSSYHIGRGGTGIVVIRYQV